MFVKNAETYTKKIVNQTTHSNHKDLANKMFTMSGDIARNSAKVYAQEIQTATVFKVATHFVKKMVPKNIGMTMLKLKIHM